MSTNPDRSEVARATVLYDGACGFCERWVARWRAQAGSRLEFLPHQEAGAGFDLAADDLRRAVHLVERDGPRAVVRSGAAAVFRIRALAGVGTGLWAAYRFVPGCAALAEAGYRIAAGRRTALARFATLLCGPSLAPSTWLLSRWILLRGLGVVFAIAFASFHVQARGLIGKDGILPMAERFPALVETLGAGRFRAFPTVFWSSFSDAALDTIGIAGIVLSLLLFVGAAPRLAIALLWVGYLSLSTVATPFLDFQWDTLLLESALYAGLLAPRGLWRPGLAADRPPSPLARGLVWWLIARLMLGSGAVKLASGDPHWADLTAMGYHYLTQPLPNPAAFAAHHLPAWAHAGATGATFAVELALPLLILLPRRPRAVACAGFVTLQVAIGATGNYGFFNLLTAFLCVTLLDDLQLGRLFPRAWRERIPEAWALRSRARPALRKLATAATLALVVLTGTIQWRRVDPAFELPWGVRHAADLVRPFRTFNAYGLFAVMTTERVELIFEGSDDGVEWKPYGFRYKPDDPRQAPCLVQPHMPRLDWQLWFAALGPRSNEWWLRRTAARLLEGSPAVLALLDENPFLERPPRYVRVVQYDFDFATPERRAADGSWWVRRPLGVCVPPLSLR